MKRIVDLAQTTKIIQSRISVGLIEPMLALAGYEAGVSSGISVPKMGRN
jgi:hypothetical protein